MQKLLALKKFLKFARSFVALMIALAPVGGTTLPAFIAPGTSR